jgi:chromosome segregation ATPase
MSHDEEMDMAMSRIGVLRYQLEQANDEIARLRSSSFVTAVPSEEYEKVKAEVTDLKANADQLKADLEKSDGVVWTLSVENARLKAEVERLTSDLQMEKENEDRLVRLHQDARNEVERLTKAGDELGEWFMDIHPSKKKWNAAKGVQL